MDMNSISSNSPRHIDSKVKHNLQQEVEKCVQQKSHSEHEETREERYKKTQNGFVITTSQGEYIPLSNFTAQITSDILLDDGVEQHRLYDMESHLYGRVDSFTISAQEFQALRWLPRHIGPEAVLYPDIRQGRAHLRVAIQLCSTPIPQRYMYGHLGWHERNGYVFYLHGGGAIDAHGVVSDIQTKLPEEFMGYVLPPPPRGETLTNTIQASLRMLEVAPDPIALPLYSAIWAAILGKADLSLHLTGATGIGKTELVSLIQQHFGPTMDARHLPANWSSTSNALEMLAFYAKDALMVVDDFAPTGSAADVQGLHRTAERLLRAQGNRSGRQRLSSDAALKPSKPPRGLIVSTGEDIPQGQSLRARVLVLEVGPQDTDFTLLTQYQKDAAAGLYAQALAGFIQWFASRYTPATGYLPRHVERLRRLAQRSSRHRRTSEIVATLFMGMHYFTQYAVEHQAMSPRDARDLRRRAWSALETAAVRQAQLLATADPVERFLELLSAAITRGRADMAATDGTPPADPQAWGWRKNRTDKHTTAEFRPCGTKIGWIKGDEVFLLPDSTYAQ